MSRFFWLLAAVICSLVGLEINGAEGPILSPETGPGSSEIAALIDQLDDAAFASRQAATMRLTELGPLVTTQLEVAADAGSREVAYRALQILKHHFQSSDESNRHAARTALEHLAGSSNVSTAQRARDILDPPQPAFVSNRWGPRPPIPPPVNNGARGIFGINGAGGLRNVSVTETAGRKTIEIDDRERSIIIAERQPGGPIEAQVTDKQNAGPVRKVVAQDLNELRRKDADLARLYEQYRSFNQQAGGGPAAMPPPVPAIPPQALKPAEAMRLQLQSLDAILDRYRKRAQTDASAQRMVEALEQTKARLKAATPAVTR